MKCLLVVEHLQSTWRGDPQSKVLKMGPVSVEAIAVWPFIQSTTSESLVPFKNRFISSRLGFGLDQQAYIIAKHQYILLKYVAYSYFISVGVALHWHKQTTLFITITRDITIIAIIDGIMLIIALVKDWFAFYGFIFRVTSGEFLQTHPK